jgi:hypothetical protein
MVSAGPSYLPFTPSPPVRMRFPALLPLLACAITLHAQTITDNVIEITVSDTVPMKTKDILYEVTPVDDAAPEYDENADYEKIQRQAEERLKQLRERLLKDAKAQGFLSADAPPTGDPYTINSYDQPYALGAVYFRVRDEAELMKLVGWLRERGKVDGRIAQWNFDDQAGTSEALMTGLYQKATAGAQRLAQLGGRKLGKLLSAKEPQEREMTFSDFFRMMDERDHGAGGMDRLIHARKRTFTFRFMLVD